MMNTPTSTCTLSKLQKLAHTQFSRLTCLYYQASFWPDNRCKQAKISSIVSLTTHLSLLPFMSAIVSESTIQKHEEKKKLLKMQLQSKLVTSSMMLKHRPGNPLTSSKYGLSSLLNKESDVASLLPCTACWEKLRLALRQVINFSALAHKGWNEIFATLW